MVPQTYFVLGLITISIRLGTNNTTICSQNPGIAKDGLWGCLTHATILLVDLMFEIVYDHHDHRDHHHHHHDQLLNLSLSKFSNIACHCWM